MGDRCLSVSRIIRDSKEESIRVSDRIKAFLDGFDQFARCIVAVWDGYLYEMAIAAIIRRIDAEHRVPFDFGEMIESVGDFY